MVTYYTVPEATSTHFWSPFHSYLYITHTHTHTQFARTEWIKNTLDPKFSKAIELDYRFEEVQKLKFSVFDIDNESSTLDDDDFLGYIECSLGEVCVCAFTCAHVCVCV